MDDLIKVLIFLLIFVVPIIRAILEQRAEKKRKQEAKELGKQVIEQALKQPPAEDEVVLAEVYDENLRKKRESLEERRQQKSEKAQKIDRGEKEKETRPKGKPKIRNKPRAQSSPTESVVEDVSVAILAEPVVLPRTSVKKTGATNLLAMDVVRIFQNPASMRQAVVIHEILNRPEERWK